MPVPELYSNQEIQTGYDTLRCMVQYVLLPTAAQKGKGHADTKG